MLLSNFITDVLIALCSFKMQVLMGLCINSFLKNINFFHIVLFICPMKMSRMIFFIDNLELLKLVNISFNLMTHAFDSRVILEEEIRG